MNKFSENLRCLRKLHKMTQEKLCEKLGYSRTMVTSWEKDISQPNIDTIIKLSDIFNVSIDELVR